MKSSSYECRSPQSLDRSPFGSRGHATADCLTPVDATSCHCGRDVYTPLAYISDTEFIETPIFSRQVDDLLSDEQYHELQVSLLFRPDAGALIPGGGGLRKVRWAPAGSGKRGGVRVIYYLDLPDCVYMLMAYRKNQQENLTPAQLMVLRNLVKEELK